MPTYLTAKVLAERGLRTVGKFPANAAAANPRELSVAMQWIEMLLNAASGIRPFVGLFTIIDIPLEAGVGDYNLDDYTDANSAQHVFSVSVVDCLGSADPDPLTMLFESQAATRDLDQTGTPCECVVTRDRLPVLRVFPKPAIEDQNAGRVLRVRLQSYSNAIDTTGIGDVTLNIRPSWHLWAVKATAYEIGNGPVLKLPDGELTRLKGDRDEQWEGLLARDGQQNSSTPPQTEPYDY